MSTRDSECPRCCGYHKTRHTGGISSPIKNEISIEDRVLLLDLEISKLNDERAQLLRERNELESPAQRCLPFEILSDIFRFVSPPIDFKARHFDTSEMVPRVNAPCTSHLTNWEINGPYLPIILGSVCAYWRQVARATPELWTTIALEVRERSAANHGRLIQLYISRSKACAVSVELDFRKEQKVKYAESPASRTTMLEDALRPIRSVVFHPKAKTKIAKLRLIAPPCEWLSSLPSLIRLEHLSLGWPFRFCLRPTESEVLDLSALRHLTHVTLSRSLKIVLPWSQITNLKLLYLPLTTCLSLLFQCENLRQCRVRYPYPDDHASEMPTHGGSITLRHLRFLEWPPISTPSMIAFFQQLNLPSLRALRWEGNGGIWGSRTRETALNFFSRLPPSMTALELIGETFPTVQRQDTVQDLFDTLPQLEHLILTGMRSELSLSCALEALGSENAHSPHGQLFLPALRVLEFRNTEKSRMAPAFDFRTELIALLHRRYLRSESGLIVKLDMGLKWSDEHKQEVREMGQNNFQVELWEEGRLLSWL